MADPNYCSVRQDYKARSPTRKDIKARAIAEAREIDEATYGSGQSPHAQEQPELVVSSVPELAAKVEQKSRTSPTKRRPGLGRWIARLRSVTRFLTCGLRGSVEDTHSENNHPFKTGSTSLIAKVMITHRVSHSRIGSSQDPKMFTVW